VIARQLTGCARPPTVDHDRVEWIVRRIGAGQLQAEFSKTLLKSGHAGNVSPMGWTVAPVRQERVFHYSEDASITRFVPHVPVTNPASPAFVWAIEACYAPLYWFPRDCPRVTVWANDDAQAARLEQEFGTTTRRLHVIETSWRATLRTTELFEYEFDGAAFEPWPDAEGQWVSRNAIGPLSVRPVGDLEQRHAAAGVELRAAGDLTAWRDSVVASGLPFSIVRFANARRE
jgi:hypothetical protein